MAENKLMPDTIGIPDLPTVPFLTDTNPDIAVLIALKNGTFRFWDITPDI